jgi:uncharacterized protein YegJ (DUF2314 family)
MQNKGFWAATIIAIGMVAFYFAPGQVETVAMPTTVVKAPEVVQPAEGPTTEGTVMLDVANSKLLEAEEKAAETLPRFIKMLEERQAGTFAIKFPLTQNGETEHIWAEVVSYDSGTFKGILSNDPVTGSKYKMGDDIDVLTTEVEDWMVRSDAGIYGAYSTRAILEQFPDQDKEGLKALFRE